ncbi:MAG TPA: peptidoglycan-binding domain-containing protein, partial [Symbiobacteriaceae bacterium]
MAQAYIGGGRTTGRSPSSLAGTPLLRRGSTGAAVRGLQRTLAKLGFYRGPIDGIFGPRTEAAVRAFQRSVGLRVDGIVGPQTRMALSQGAYVRRVTTRPQPRPAPRPAPQPTNLLSRLRQGVSNVLNRLRQSIQQTTRRTVLTPFGFMPEDLARTITGDFSDIGPPRRPATAADVARFFLSTA